MLAALLLGAVTIAAGPCDLRKADAVRDLLWEMETHRRPALAAAWLAEACVLPEALDSALGAVAGVDPGRVGLLAAEAATRDPELLLAACTGGPRAIAEAVSGAPAARRAALFDGCGLERHSAADRAAFVAATEGDPLLYLLTAQALSSQGSDPSVRETLRALAGLPSPRAPRQPIVPRRL